MRIAATMVVILGVAVAPARGDEKCMYDQEFFTPGAVSCQNGMQFRCVVGGSWKKTGLECADTGADAGEPEIHVDPNRNKPAVREPAVRQPGAPTVDPD